MIYARRVLAVLERLCPTVFFWQQFLHFPVALASAYGELEIFLGNGVPIL